VAVLAGEHGDPEIIRGDKFAGGLQHEPANGSAEYPTYIHPEQ
jgi:hypothetical protein